MNYFLLSLLLLINHNDAEDISPKNDTHWNDSIAVKISAGYEVGADQSSNNSPKGTTKINQPQNYLSNILSRETIPIIREPRTLTNFTPQVGNPNLEKTKNQFKSKNRIVDSRTAASNNFGTDNIQSYQVHEAFSDDGNTYSKAKPSLVDLHNIVNNLEKNKAYSKIVQVIKVPAVYEIHLQSDVDKNNHVNLLAGSFNHNENFDWKNHYENKPALSNLNHDGQLNWENHYDNKPVLDNLNHNEQLNWKNHYDYKPAFNNLIHSEHSDWKNSNENKHIPNNFNTNLLSDDYLKWLNNYYKQKEDAFSKESENYYKPISITSHENYDKPDWIDHLQENEFLEPIISHHYRHTQFDDKLDGKGVFTKYGIDGHRKPPTNTWLHKDHVPHRNTHYISNNLKRDIGGKSFNSISPSYGMNSNKFPQNKKLLNINHKNLNLKSNSIKQNQEITEFNHPEAIHIVPAPYLGKHSYPRPFEAQSLSKADTYSKPLPTPQNVQNNLSHVKFNNFIPNLRPKQNSHNVPEFPVSQTTISPFGKPSDVFPGTVYGRVSEKKFNHQNFDRLQPETVPTSEDFASYINKNQNLVYGKQTEAVLSPYEINIPLTPETTPLTFSANHENKIYKKMHQPLSYPDTIINYRLTSNYDQHYSPNALQRISNDQTSDDQFQGKDCMENGKFYETVPITTHTPDVGSYSNDNQETLNKKSNTNPYSGEDLKDKSQDIKNVESNENLNSTRRMSKHEYKDFIIKKTPQHNLLDTIKNLPNKIFAKNQHMKKSPLKGMIKKQNNGAHLDYIIYITEKTKHEDDKLF